MTRALWERLYMESAHRVQTAVHALMTMTPGGWRAAEPKHMRVGIDMQKSDSAALVRLLIKKGVITEDEHLEALAAAAKEEADLYEKTVQSVLGNRNIKTG